MNQTTATTATKTHPADVEALRLQLEENGKDYHYKNSKEAHERLLHTLETNDCREITTAVVAGCDLATVFTEAGNRGHIDILEAFLNHGMKIDIKDKNGWTALIHASANGHVQCVRFLFDRNASVDVQDQNGFAALMLASMNGFTKIVEMLLEKNANLDLQNKSGRTALMFASLRSYEETVQVLLNHDADVELNDNYGRTALDLAKDEEIKEIIRNHVPTSYLLK